jgi:hypothetical protein
MSEIIAIAGSRIALMLMLPTADCRRAREK